jgi:hypothetical protein
MKIEMKTKTNYAKTSAPFSNTQTLNGNRHGKKMQAGLQIKTALTP